MIIIMIKQSRNVTLSLQDKLPHYLEPGGIRPLTTQPVFQKKKKNRRSWALIHSTHQENLVVIKHCKWPNYPQTHSHSIAGKWQPTGILFHLNRQHPQTTGRKSMPWVRPSSVTEANLWVPDLCPLSSNPANGCHLHAPVSLPEGFLWPS